MPKRITGSGRSPQRTPAKRTGIQKGRQTRKSPTEATVDKYRRIRNRKKLIALGKTPHTGPHSRALRRLAESATFKDANLTDEQLQQFQFKNRNVAQIQPPMNIEPEQPTTPSVQEEISFDSHLPPTSESDSGEERDTQFEADSDVELFRESSTEREEAANRAEQAALKAQQDAKATKKDAAEFSKNIKLKANQVADQIKLTAQQDAEKIIDQAKLGTAQEKQKAQKEAQIIRNNASQVSQRIHLEAKEKQKQAEAIVQKAEKAAATKTEKAKQMMQKAQGQRLQAQLDTNVAARQKLDAKFAMDDVAFQKKNLEKQKQEITDLMTQHGDILHQAQIEAKKAGADTQKAKKIMYDAKAKAQELKVLYDKLKAKYERRRKEVESGEANLKKRKAEFDAKVASVTKKRRVATGIGTTVSTVATTGLSLAAEELFKKGIKAASLSAHLDKSGYIATGLGIVVGLAIGLKVSQRVSQWYWPAEK